MTDKSPQRERFEASDDVISKLAEWWSGERGSNVARGDIKALLKRYHRLVANNSPTDQPAVAGAVDEEAEYERHTKGMVLTETDRRFGYAMWLARSYLRTASPSQPAAEDDQITSIIANAEQWEDDTGEKFVSFELSPDQRDAVLNTLRRASPADDGEMKS